MATLLVLHGPNLNLLGEAVLGEDEADLKHGLINISSPIARALIGKDEGDSVEVQTPGGTIER